MFEELEIKRVSLEAGILVLKDKVVREVPFTIIVNGEQLATLLASPLQLKELAVGYLYVEGFIPSADEISSLIIDQNTFIAKLEIKKQLSIAELSKKRVITSGCGRNISFYNFEDFKSCVPVQSPLKIEAKIILDLIAEFQKKSTIFKETGGVHSAAVCQAGAIISFAEDLGRHNAVDKVIGGLVLAGQTAEDKFLLLSGRISSEMLLKAARIGMPIIVSRSAPTDMAIRLAKQFKITLVGFARGQRMNIYSEEGRILCQK
ncbi:formate dehydrogenase family accessory protein FdhD [candidate division WOR-1 bacterium RIFOXYB2_FULL_42_35]|uniref:Sulfur carrier protein FdhD n=1 Tax=candidate division WOR-1 bacterium RIFOXYC2_FULL_41_25 TaxID=1802586 RepID=A0A1F4TND4_UNCSA|nr:MAG: formate dehydrogenase family accessory protein FdhD [candidate division WOR-1 bacterium RIFOXYA2_FULL_41_14]OGC24671.1 MAG: formate dehydrogenase family accessory protein FdhD [candidate division WOR-1 bacterium RIFOXYB2_FULL_42_35]OGC34186.1 MAG: formate dehydrogenase family accessory protein FdhD [candidate division WOR-1 bacterium RIFOXYC2_FULL_41_25]OGC42453.1 MAG: formate dehydrogenase family accessory protein FdhD [candidate division WOR-1 bacterium RIFOXYD2_FULL_41_8]